MTALEQNLQQNIEAHQTSPKTENDGTQSEEKEVKNPFEENDTKSTTYKSDPFEIKFNDDPFGASFDEDPFADHSDNAGTTQRTEDVTIINKSTPTILKHQLTLYSSMEELEQPLPLPYKKHCTSKIWYYFETLLVTHPRIYALYLLYQSTWPRGLVLLDMYTDVQVGLSLFENGETLWFMLSAMFIALPFIL